MSGNARVDEVQSGGRGAGGGEPRILRRVLLLGVPLTLVLLCLLPGIGPVFRLFNITSTNMAPTLSLGDYVAVSRASYGYSRSSFDGFELPIEGRLPALAPRRGDVVVFRVPREPSTFYVTRVIGLPGDRVRMKDGRLVLNGATVPREAAARVADPLGERGDVASYFERLPEGVSYRIIDSAGDDGFLDTTEELEVPAGHLFMMGDNRDNSNDSRVPGDKHGVGLVPVELVLGRVVAAL